MVAVMAWEEYWYSDPALNLPWEQSVHGEQSIEWHAPVPVEGEVIGEAFVDELYDKGEGRGALLAIRRELTEIRKSVHLATVRQSVFFRNGGGFGGPKAAPNARRIPETQPDVRHCLSTRPEQALLYRLTGDRFPLHVDPSFAKASGFEQPILHGLCSYGFAGRVLVSQLCDGDGTRLRRMDCRFSAPVFPGDTIEVLIWRIAPGEAAFVCRAGERIVIQNGYVRFD
jgi:acyl dehydratase